MTDVGVLDQLGRDLLLTVFPRAEDLRGRRAGGCSLSRCTRVYAAMC